MLARTNKSSSNKSILNNNRNNNDEVCSICNEWMLNQQDFIHNFLKCDQCTASYHRQCAQFIIPSAANINKFYSCAQIKKQCIANRIHPIKVIKFTEGAYDCHKIFTDEYQSACIARNYYKSIEYKGIPLTVGDVIEVRNENSETLGPQWATNVAMIKEIFYDEDTDIPHVIIFWYWREMEIKWQIESEGIHDIVIKHESNTTERKKFVDYHIYLDQDYQDTIAINTIMHKVIVFDKFNQFKQYYNRYQDKRFGFGAVFYGELFFCAPKCSFGIQKKESFKRFLRHKHGLKPRKKQKENAKSTKNANKFDDIPILTRLKKGIVEESEVTDSDCTESDDEPIKLKLQKLQNSKMKKKIKTKTQRKTIIEENKAKITNHAMNEMQTICNKLRITKGPNIGSKLYHFENHQAVYQCIDNLFGKYDATSFQSFIDKQKQSFCRDIKYALYTPGQIVPLTAMKKNIYLRFLELFKIKTRKRNINEIANNNNIELMKKKRKL